MTGIVEGFAQLMADGKSQHHGVVLEEEALRAAVEWSIRYLPDFRLPDKALDGVDQACAAVRFGTLTPRKNENSAGETIRLKGKDGRMRIVGQ